MPIKEEEEPQGRRFLRTLLCVGIVKTLERQVGEIHVGPADVN